MKTTYFKNVQTLEELRSQYKTLLKKSDTDKTSYNNMKYDFSEDEKLREILNKIIHFNNITIEIVGCWIWCFNSYAYKKN